MIVKSLIKAVCILDYIAEQDKPVGVTDISTVLGMPKSTVSNVLQTFETVRWVEQHPDTRKFMLSIRLFELGNIVRSGLELREIGIPYMRQLVEDLGETVHLTTLMEGEVIYLESAQPDNYFATASVTGRRAHMHCTGVGKAILAFLAPEQIVDIVKSKGLPRFTPNTITNFEDLRHELSIIRERGYAIDDMEHEHGIKCVAVPIFNENGLVVASMSVTGPSPRFPETRIPKCANYLLSAAEEISRHLGWSGFMANAAHQDKRDKRQKLV